VSQEELADFRPAPGFWRNRLFRALSGWLLGLVFLSYALWLCLSNPVFSESLGKLSFDLLGLLLVAQGMCLWVNSSRNLTVFRHVGLRGISHVAWFRVFIFARILNMIIGQSGNVYRALRLKRGWSFTYTNTVSCYAGFAWLDMLLNTFLMSVALLIWDPEMRLAGVSALLLSSSFFFLLLIGLPIVALAGRRIRAGMPNESGAFGKLFRNAGEAMRALANIRLLLTISLIGLASFFLQLLTVYGAFLSLGRSPGLANLVIFVCVIRFSTLIMLTPGNLGVLEVACGYLSSAMGMDMSQGLLVAGVLRVVSWINLGLFGGVLAIGGIGVDIRQKTERKGASIDEL
jgi:uncharacterized membrane protein YbhN (UPF0104 family)